MDMKLNHELIKQLRLKHSWSQEKLAEVSHLNPRTIQRVEADGSGSLQTRLRLARAFGIEPGALDYVELLQSTSLAMDAKTETPLHPQAATTFSNNYHLPLLLLLSAIYLAWTPLYFDLSFTSFNYVDYGQYFHGSWLWLALIIGVWLAFSVAWLAVVFRRNKAAMTLHAGFLLTPLMIGVLRVWQPELVRHLLTYALYLSVLALLVSFYKPQVKSKVLQHAVNLSLLNYLFMWCFHTVLFGFAYGALHRWQAGLSFELPWLNFGTFLVNRLSNVAHLLPVVLVVLFSMGRDNDATKLPFLLSLRRQAA